MQLYNKISRIRDGIPDHHKLFEKLLSKRPDPDAEIHALIAEAKKSGNLENFRDQFFKEQYEKSKQKMDIIEIMKVYYDIGHEEDCLETIQGGLRMRTAIAFEHDRGNTDFTVSDFLNKVLNSIEK
jgi:arginine deiminase